MKGHTADNSQVYSTLSFFPQSAAVNGVYRGYVQVEGDAVGVSGELHPLFLRTAIVFTRVNDL
jgi:hypothetical protein